MKVDIQEIIHEWFYRLPNGYADKPYSNEDLQILEDILKEWNISNFKTIIQHLAETDKEEHTNIEPDPDTQSEPETHESNEDFRNLLDSYENFSDIIYKRYVSTGLSINGLDELYKRLMNLPDSLQNQMRRLIGKRTNRDLVGGTFKMGQYEKMLYDLIHESIQIENSHPYVFWFAIVLDGKIKGEESNSTVAGNVFIDQQNVLIRKFHNEVISLGLLDPEIVSILQILINLGEVIDGEKTEELTKTAINSLLMKISDEENKDELDQFLNLSNTTKLSALKSLSNSIKSSLENHQIDELPIKFTQLIDAFISRQLATIQYWVTIRGDMCYMTTGESLYPALNCTKEHRLGGGIFNIKDNILYVLGDIINEKLM